MCTKPDKYETATTEIATCKKKNHTPKNSLAHKIIRLNGWTESDAINEIAHCDKVDEKEAARRYKVARQQMINRMNGQKRRQDLAKEAIEDGKQLVLAIIQNEGAFLCSKHLSRISARVGWGYTQGLKSTGRVMHEIIFPLEKAGLITEILDEDMKFIGYR